MHPPARRRPLLSAAATTALFAGSLVSFAPPALAADLRGDILSVDLSDGTFADHAQGLTPAISGKPAVESSAALLGRSVASLNGSGDAVAYPMAEQWSKLTSAVTVQCTFRFDGVLPTTAENAVCANKEAGGLSITVSGSNVVFMAYVKGAYKSVRAPIEAHRWYHVAGVFDGKTVKLYLDGTQSASAAAVGEIAWPSNPGASNFVVGGDSSTNPTRHQFFAPMTIATAEVHSRALSAAELSSSAGQELDAARAASKANLTVESTTPAAGQRLTTETKLEVNFKDRALLATEPATAVDGRALPVGDKIAGLKEGRHSLTIEAADQFGAQLEKRVDFTSAHLPGAGGSGQEQGKGSVTLSATASNPGGGKITTTFSEAQATLPTRVETGVVEAMPTKRDFTGTQVQELTGSPKPGDGSTMDSPSTGKGLPYQRFDVDVNADLKGEEFIRWAGVVDPTREASLLAWDQQGQRWEQLGTTRGSAEGEVVMTGSLQARHVDGAAAHVLVIASDPFADDFARDVDQAFDDPSSYDFSLAHLTDTQYLTEGAVENATSEERAVWNSAYAKVWEWVAKNKDEYKIAYAAHTGDIAENWHSNGAVADEAAYRANAAREFEVASKNQDIIDASGIPNGVLPGNHDNRSGADVGADMLYNDYFGPDRYERVSQQQGWRDAKASYHPWKEDDNDNHYDLFSAGGLDFVAVYLGFDVTDEEAAWADGVLKQYKDRNALILTHAYSTPSTNPNGRGSSFSHDGQRVFEKVIEPNPNVALVLSGHEHGVSIGVKKDVGSKGNHVVELLADYQFYEVPAKEVGLAQGTDARKPEDLLRFGSSFFRLLQVDVDRSELSIDTYSPLLDQFNATKYDDRQRYDGSEDDTKLPLQLETRTTSFATDSLVLVTPGGPEIGAATADSGQPATVTWKGLTSGEVYAYTAISRDAGSGKELARVSSLRATGDEPGEVRQHGLFTATDAGTDATAPVISFPASTVIKQGTSLDLLAGVSAKDAVDGDVTDSLSVHGSVDTSVPGRYTVLYQATDSNANTVTAARSVVVEAVADPLPPEHGGDGSGMGEDGGDSPEAPGGGSNNPSDPSDVPTSSQDAGAGKQDTDPTAVSGEKAESGAAQDAEAGEDSSLAATGAQVTGLAVAGGALGLLGLLALIGNAMRKRRIGDRRS